VFRATARLPPKSLLGHGPGRHRIEEETSGSRG
jgi:hypothetical protein